jgi:hypothetical protein
MWLRERLPSTKKWLIVSVVVVLALSSVSVFVLFTMQPAKVYFSMKAAIVDQLAEDAPNPVFREDVTTLLSDYGFTVSYYNDTDVEFFTHLAESNYGIIILRAHMALRMELTENGSKVPVAVDLFTSEPYDETKHVAEQNAQLLSRGELNYSGVKHYFAITPRFIEKLQGIFPHSLVIATGCSALKAGLTEMADSFISKGSKVFMGWTDLVSNNHSDEETITLIQELVENRTVNQAAKSLAWDYSFYQNGTYMDYYPKPIGNVRLSDLVSESTVHEASPSLHYLTHDSGFGIASDAMPINISYSRLEKV